METSPGQRLRQWRDFKGLTLADVSRATGIRTTTLSTTEQPGASNPSYDTISKVLAAYPDLNPDWLLLGTGTMLRDGREFARVAPQPGHTTESTTVAEFENLILRERLADQKEQINDLRSTIAFLKEELGKFPGSPEAAGGWPGPLAPVRGRAMAYAGR